MRSRRGAVDSTAKILRAVLIAGLSAGAVVLILVILTEPRAEQASAETVGLTVVFGFCSLTAAAGANLARRQPKLAPIGYLTVAVSLIAFLLDVGLVSSVLHEEKLAVYGPLAAFAFGHTSILLAAGRPSHGLPFRLVQIGSLITTWALIVLAVVDIAAYPEDPPVGLEPIAVVGVLFALGTVITLLLGRAGLPAAVQEDGAAPEGSGPQSLRLDHLVIGITDWERSNAFYRDVLGAEVIGLPGGRYAYRIGDQQLSPHGPGTGATPLAAQPVGPGNSDVCFAWSGSAEGALDHLRRHDIPVEMGPVQRVGAGGDGESVYFRDPDGSLIELIAYG